MIFQDYTVTIHFTNFLGKPDINTFDVMAYSKEEAQETAFSKFSDVHGDNYEKIKRFDVELYEDCEEF
tara:strand:+ start:1053 stop:1256 length:204 start_codon:yes stop_codon:yes gene_type:complete